jgi:predicted nuclease of restriction endonuclease-like (RecB) superfamily
LCHRSRHHCRGGTISPCARSCGTRGAGVPLPRRDRARPEPGDPRGPDRDRLGLRQGQATTNFARTLPAPQTALVRQALQDPSTFDFLTLGPDARERDLERGLLTHLRAFMLERGVGFAFLGSQYHLAVGGEDPSLDPLFYHVRLRCSVVIDRKRTACKPEYAGKLNFYLSAVDDLLRHPDDGPTIGTLLCRGQNRVLVEYALRDSAKPLGAETRARRGVMARARDVHDR